MDKKKKGILIAFACLVVFAVVGSIFTFGDLDMTAWGNGRKEETQKTSFYFYPADFSADILQEPAYLDLDRAIRLTDGGVTTVLSEPYGQYGDAIARLCEYLEAAIAGDHETLNACFTESYLREYGEKPNFPMQRLYDITLEKIGEASLSEGDYRGMTRYTFHVTYKIRQNDGRFDNGIPSDAYKVRVYELLGDINGVKINSIGEYRMG